MKYTRIEGETGCKIIEIGKKGKYYYGKISSYGITIYREGKNLHSLCKNEYFLINKEDILNITKEYKVKKPYEFFIFSILR